MAHFKPVVLVVEDEVLVRMGIADHLGEHGFTVLEAADADEARDILDGNRDIGAVFTDIDMPGSMDGLKLAAIVRDRWPPVRILVTSGHRQVEASDLPRDAQFFPKPYNPDKLAAALRDLTA